MPVCPRDPSNNRRSAAAPNPNSDRNEPGSSEAKPEGYFLGEVEFLDRRPVDWVYLHVNPAFATLTGVDQVLGRRSSELSPPVWREHSELLEACGRVVTGGSTESLELHLNSSGTRLAVSVFPADEGRFAAVIGNINGQGRAEEELRESGARYVSVVNTSTDAIFINREGTVVLVNPACLRLFGADHERQLLGRQAFELIHPSCHENVRQRIRHMLDRWEPAPAAEQQIVRLDGTTVDVEVVAAPFLDQGQRAIHVMMRDISARKLAEEQLRHQQVMLREAGELAQVGGWEFDPATGEGSWTEETARIHDLDPSDSASTALGLSFYEGESRSRIEAAVQEAIASGTPYDLELEMTSASGIIKRVRTICHPEVEGGRVVRVRGAIQDISARVATDQALVAERSRLRTVLDTIPDLVWLKDPDGAFLSCNHAFERLLGATEEELVGHTDYDFVAPELADLFRFHDRRAIETGGPAINEEWVPSADREVPVLLETIKTPMHDPSGRLLGVLGIARDVTEVRATAEALRQSEERLRLFIEHAPVALAMFDRQMRYVSASRRWCADFELTYATLMGSCHYDLFPEIRPDWREVHRRALDGEVVRADEDRFERADGSVQWLRWEVRPWRDTSGGVAGIVVFSEDISERKRNTAALAESEAHFRALAETTFDWIWEVDAASRYTFVSPRVRELLGYSPQEVLGRTPFSLMPAEEGRRVEAAFAAAAMRQEPLAAIENVNVHKSGRLVVLESSAVPYFSPTGEYRGYRGMNRDITARKRAENRSAIQARVSLVLAESASLTEAAPRVLAAIGQSEGWPSGALWAVDDDEQVLRCFGRWPDDPTTLAEEAGTSRLGRGEGFPGEVWECAQPRLRPDLTTSTSPQPQATDETALRGAVGFPVCLAGKVIGVVEFHGASLPEVDAGAMEMFEAVGRQLGLFVERWRAETTMSRFVAGSPAVIYALRVGPDRLHLIWHGGNLERMTGWDDLDSASTSWWLENVHPEDRERVAAAHMVPYEVDHQVTEFRFRGKEGRYLWVHDEKRLLRDAGSQPREIVGSWTDVTERVQLEEQLRASQKLEAIGRLAGGVAHDFNNILTVISGNAELLARALPAEGSEGIVLGEIREAAERAAALTRQLLAFSRSQVLAPQVVALDEVVRRVETMLRRLIGEDVQLVCELPAEPLHVLVDPGQIEQVIVNLAVNARDAMPRGGQLAIVSDALTIDEATSQHHADVEAGSYARLVVRDNGCGMSPAVRDRIFEPFFTTKPQGQGTGLGLATVFGILAQSGGHIEVESEEGVGTTFRILLPLVGPPAAAAGAPRIVPGERRGGETILLVEDEPGVRRLARIALERSGYTVLVATDGRDAMALTEAHSDGIDLVVTDLVMPEMGGRELAEALRARWPRIGVLLMSGYVEDDLVRHGVVEAEVAFLHKPFSLAELTSRVRSLLDAERGGGEPGTGQFTLT